MVFSMSNISNKNDKKFLITGMMRSGTTLLQRALASHPDVYIEYQPDIQCFIDIKCHYLSSLGLKSSHPLANYNSQDHYKLDDLSLWLQCRESTLIDVYFDKLSLYANRGIVGSKEVLIEEFVPFFLANGLKCLIVVRDPRDVLTSLHYGSQTNTGLNRPTLFEIRNWRKSIQIARKMSNSPFLQIVKYEELVSFPSMMLQKIFAWLGVEAFEYSSVIAKMSEQQWYGNSSFRALRPFDKNNIGNYHTILPKETVGYIEACCSEELLWAGYPHAEMDLATRLEIISNFEEPLNISRNEFESNYSTSEESVSYEFERLINYPHQLYV